MKAMDKEKYQNLNNFYTEEYNPETEAVSDFLQNKETNVHLINVKNGRTPRCVKTLRSVCKYRLPSGNISSLTSLHDSFVRGRISLNVSNDLFVLNMSELQVPSDFTRLEELLSSNTNDYKHNYKLILIKPEGLIFHSNDINSQSFF